ncbi:MAG: efflux RND transporter permease subunit [Nitrospirota bacterium]|nr:efflux RND transporter permease subunit [Nitrospirota bacterium]
MIHWFARNEVAANLMMVVILGLGFWSLSERTPLEVFPEFERDAATISMSYRGATPQEVEQSLVTRIEEAIADLEGIKEISSNAAEGVARIRVEFEKGQDQRALLDDIKTRVDAINTFPDEAERPVYGLAVFRREVISVVVSGDLPEARLRALGERVRDDLTALPEVSMAELTAVRAPEISVEVSEHTLERYGLTFDAVVDAVRRSSVDLPAGSIRTGGGEILLRTRGQAYVADDFARIVVRTRPDGTRITLGDMAHIRDGFEEEPLRALFNGRPAALIEVYRTGDQSALEIGRAVREYVGQARAHMPPGVAVDYWRDRSRIVQLRLNTLLTSAWQGGILIFLTLALFLRLSVAVWVCVGIPVSFMGALALMPELGVTINIISLFAFILVLGIVVDDAIVTGENIYSHLKRAESSIEAAVKGAQEVAVPVTFGLLTTVVAFLPLLFMEGRRGPIFAQIPLIVIPVLLFSWVESKLILPAHMRHVKVGRHLQHGPLTRLQRKIADGLERGIAIWYGPLLARCLERRYLTVALFVAVSFVVLSFFISGRYGFVFFPRVQSETARATLVMQAGTAAETTLAQVNRMGAAAETLRTRFTNADGTPVVRNVLVSVGEAQGGGGQPGGGGRSETGQVSLELTPPEERGVDITTTEIVAAWRKAIGGVPGAKELSYRAEIGRGGDPIDVRLSGQDFELLDRLAEGIKARLREYPGVYDIKDSFDEGKPQIELAVRADAEPLGLSATDLGRQVRQAFFGAEAQRIQRGRDDVRVMVRFPEAERRSVGTLEQMRIRTADGVGVPLGTVADVQVGQGFSTIRRVDRERVVNVTADLDKERTDVRRIVADLEVYLADMRARHPEVRYSLEGELREQAESFGSLAYGTAFTLFAIYALLAIPFRSYLQPLVVMLVIPFSIVGALVGHMLMGMDLSLMSMMGMLALAGVVVNDSLVMVDWINRTRSQGGSLDEAVRTAGVARFRPILLTSVTTFAGLLPLLTEKSTQAQFLIPMAVSLGFGILYATALSLLLVPVGYRILEDAREVVSRLGGPRASAG